MRYEAELEETSLTAYDGIKKVNPEKDRESAPFEVLSAFSS